jgi:hypothetical protein
MLLPPSFTGGAIDTAGALLLPLLLLPLLLLPLLLLLALSVTTAAGLEAVALVLHSPWYCTFSPLQAAAHSLLRVLPAAVQTGL